MACQQDGRLGPPRAAPPCRLAVRYGSLDEQEQSPVLSALEQRKAAAAALPPAERRKTERLAMQVGFIAPQQCASTRP